MRGVRFLEEEEEEEEGFYMEGLGIRGKMVGGEVGVWELSCARGARLTSSVEGGVWLTMVVALWVKHQNS
jgi:hypothetical protein